MSAEFYKLNIIITMQINGKQHPYMDLKSNYHKTKEYCCLDISRFIEQKFKENASEFGLDHLQVKLVEDLLGVKDEKTIKKLLEEYYEKLDVEIKVYFTSTKKENGDYKQLSLEDLERLSNIINNTAMLSDDKRQFYPYQLKIFNSLEQRYKGYT
jgi:hypothetical protein